MATGLEDLTSEVVATAANQRVALDRRTRQFSHTADLTLTNVSAGNVYAPLHAAFHVQGLAVQMPGAQGAPGVAPYDTFYYDVSNLLAGGELPSAAAVTFPIRIISTSRVTYDITVWGQRESPAENERPVADAGAAQWVYVGDTVQLDGGLSSDPNDDPLTFGWTIASKPTGSSAALTDPAAANPAFDADEPGTYEVTLIVHDGLVDSIPDTVTVVAQEPVVTVPDVWGLPRADAETIIEAAGLTVGEVATGTTSAVPAGSVVSQEPPPDSLVSPQSPVALLVSLGNRAWERRYRSADEAAYSSALLRAGSVSAVEDGGYAFAAHLYRPDPSATTVGDIWLLKTDAGGGVLWQRTYDGDLDEAPVALRAVGAGGYIVLGSQAGNRLWVLRLDAGGEVEWQGRYTPTGFLGLVAPRSLVETGDGDFLIGGYYGGGIDAPFIESARAFVLKLHSNGNVEWQRWYGESGATIFDLKTTPDGGAIVTGSVTYTLGSSQIRHTSVWVTKLDGAGEIQWQRVLDPAPRVLGSFALGSSVLVGDDGGYIVGGRASVAENRDDAWIVKLTSAGDIEWQKRFNLDHHDFEHPIVHSRMTLDSLALTEDGGLVAAGGVSHSNWSSESAGPHLIGEEGWLLQLDRAGSVEWLELLTDRGAPTPNLGSQLSWAEQIADGSFMVAGSAHYGGRSRVWLMQVNSDGSTGCGYARVLDAVVSETTAEIRDVAVPSFEQALFASEDAPVLVAATPPEVTERCGIDDAPIWISDSLFELKAYADRIFARRAACTDPESEPVIYALDAAPAGLSIDPTTGLMTWSPTPSQIAEHTLGLRCEDAAGLAVTRSATIEVTAGPNLPAITSMPQTRAVEGQLYAYQVEAVDDDLGHGDVLTYALNLAPPGMTIDPTTGFVQWLPTSAQIGQHAVNVRVLDRAGGFDDQLFTLVVEWINDPPRITSSPIDAAQAGWPYFYRVTAEDPDPLDTLAFTLEVAPAGMTIDPASGLLRWFPSNAEAGANDITVRVSDLGGLWAEQSFVLVVSVNHPPTITSTPVTTVTSGQEYRYDVQAQDPDPGDALWFDFDEAAGFPPPAGMHIDNAAGLIVWVPSSGQVGSHEVAIRVMDPAGLYDSQRFTLTVTAPVIRPPVITTLPPTRALVGRPYYYQILADDPDSGDTLTYTLDQSPAGMTIDAAYGLVQWLADATQIGAHAVAIAVTDASGLQATQSFTIDVPPPSETDTDGDGYTPVQGDCNDTVPFVHPDQDEIANNQVDEDCDGADLVTSGPRFYPVDAYPAAVVWGTQTDITFSVRLAATEPRPSQVLLEEIDAADNVLRTPGPLVDDGTLGDSQAYDLVYSGTYTVDGDLEGPHHYRAVAEFAALPDAVYAPRHTVHVTPLPVRVRPSDMGEAVPDPYQGGEIIANEVLVVFAWDTSAATIETIAAAVGATVVGSLPDLQAFQLEISSSEGAVGVYATVARLAQYPEVVFAEPNRVTGVAEVPVSDPGFEPDDPNRLALEAVRAPQTWNIAQGSFPLLGPVLGLPREAWPGVRVAVVDPGGVKHNHYDLQARVLVDEGWDFGDDDPDAGPDHGNAHGTEVAGIIVAQRNGRGVVGMCWDCTVIPIKLGTVAKPGKAPKLRSVAGIVHATKKHARVINASYGNYQSSYLEKSVVAAATHRRGALVVAAAGNDRCQDKVYPAGYEDALAVGATTRTPAGEHIAIWKPQAPWCTKGAGSNFGPWVDVAAPGTFMSSTSFFPVGPLWPLWEDTVAAGLKGTSFAAPMVSGAAALVWSLHPEWGPLEVRERLIETARPLPPGEFGPPGQNAGLLDVFEATFNGSFETGDLSDWKMRSRFTLGWDCDFWDAGAIDRLLPFEPEEVEAVPVERDGHKDFMAYIGTGADTPPGCPDHLYVGTWLWRAFFVYPEATDITISFDYNYLTDEYPEWWTADYFSAWAEFGNQEISLAEEVPREFDNWITTLLQDATLGWARECHTPLVCEDNVVGARGWDQASSPLALTLGEWVTLQFFVKQGPHPASVHLGTDYTDLAADSVLLIDNVTIE
jgi:hypothetical protein